MSDHDLAPGLGATLPLPFEQAVERTKEALIAEGFGILTEIDAAAPLRRRLGVDSRACRILGAYDPPLPYGAPPTEPDAGLLLPFNVLVYAAETPERSVVAMLDPMASLSLARDSEPAPSSNAVTLRVRRAIVGAAALASTRSASRPLEPFEPDAIGRRS
jgi:uncharacterized protein (DUF302 family)